MTISEACSIPGCAELTFLPPIGGNAGKSWLFGGIGPRGDKENADNRSKSRCHVPSKAGCRDVNNPGGACLSGLAPLKESEMSGIVDATGFGFILKIIGFLLKNRLSGPRNAL